MNLVSLLASKTKTNKQTNNVQIKNVELISIEMYLHIHVGFLPVTLKILERAVQA